MLTIKNLRWVFKALSRLENRRPGFGIAVICFLIFLLTGCMPAGPRALLDGVRLLERGKYAEALEKLRAVTAAQSPLTTNAQAWNYYGLACQHTGNVADAEQAYKKALALSPDLTEAHFNLGCLWLAQNKLDSAKSEFTAYTLRRGNSPEGFVELGTVQLRLSAQHGPQLRAIEQEAAERAFSKAVELAPQNAEAWNGKGLVKLERGRASEAVECFNTALKGQPGYPPALLNLAIVSHQYLRDRPMALAKYREYLQVQPAPENAEAVRSIVHELEQQVMPSPGRPATNQVAQSNPGVQQPMSGPGAATKQASSPKTNGVETVAKSGVPSTAPKPESPPAAKPATTSGPRPTESTQALPQSNLHASQERAPAGASNQNAVAGPMVAGSTRAGEAATTNPPRRTLFQRLFGTNSKGASNVVQVDPARVSGTSAAEMAGSSVTPAFPRYPYRTSRRLVPGDRAAAERRFAQGVQAYQAHRLADAVQSYAQAVQLDPAFFDAYYNLGWAAAESGKLPVSLAAYENALSIRPDSGDARYNFALVLQRADYMVDAANELEKLAAAEPAQVRAHLALGNLYAQQLHEPTKAREHFTKVLEIDPHNPQAAAIRSWLAAK
jgi:tetratricopeptide (TPR) repeat protein